MVEKPYLSIDLGKHTPIYALKFYNYNKSLEDSFRGVKKIKIHIDDCCISPVEGHMVRKAPGNSSFDFGHTINLTAGSTSSSLGQVSNIEINLTHVRAFTIRMYLTLVSRKLLCELNQVSWKHQELKIMKRHCYHVVVSILLLQLTRRCFQVSSYIIIW
jgi:hypothetical protein